MKRIALPVALATALVVATALALPLTVVLCQTAHAQGSQGAKSCAEFQNLVRKTYNFDESKLSIRQKLAKEPELNRFWSVVKAKRRAYVPCLRAALGDALDDPKANAAFRNPFFWFDGSNLLVTLDPSTASKALQVRVYTKTDLDLAGARRWMAVLTQRGSEGFDVSAAALRWLSDPKAHYTIPEHGDFPVGTLEGALFLFGSMNEAQATPALLKIAQQKDHPDREIALWLLFQQATPTALHALAKLDTAGLSEEAQQDLQIMLTQPELLTPRAKPQTSRQEFLQAFNDIVQGNSRRFFALVERVPDGEHDAVAVLQPADLPLLRKVRRLFITGGNQHSISYYKDLTAIILALVWKPELVRPSAATQ